MVHTMATDTQPQLEQELEQQLDLRDPKVRELLHNKSTSSDAGRTGLLSWEARTQLQPVLALVS